MKKAFLFIFSLCLYVVSMSQELIETGGQKMPDTWIDKDTHHRLVRLTDSSRSNMSFYFHNDPFVGNEMIYYSSARTRPEDINVTKQETYNSNSRDKQIYAVDINTRKAEPLTHQASPMNGELVAKKSGNVYYQIKDSVFVVNVHTKKTSLVYVFPADYQGSVATVNEDETYLAGSKASDAQKDIYKKNPEKKDYFNLIYDAHLPNDLFAVEIATKKLSKIHSENTWLGHVQFSPTDPDLLMFCHEGPWHLVDRIWTINIKTKEAILRHKRTMNMEIAGHEFPSPDGKKIYYDLQMPKGQTFFLGSTELATGKEEKVGLTRNEWSIHFTVSRDGKLYAGDGGDPGQVAKAPDGEWIYLFKKDGDHFVSEKLVNMKNHNYHLEPNVHFSPDGKWIIFRANFEGDSQVYAVEIAKSNK